MQFVHSAQLLDAMAEAMREQDHDLGNDIEPFDYYTEKARVAATAYDTYTTTPRVKRTPVEGLLFLYCDQEVTEER